MAYYREDLYERQRERADTAESRIAAALACHTLDHDDGDGYAECTCTLPWDTEADRCTSPTVTALTGKEHLPKT